MIDSVEPLEVLGLFWGAVLEAVFLLVMLRIFQPPPPESGTALRPPAFLERFAAPSRRDRVLRGDPRPDDQSLPAGRGTGGDRRVVDRGPRAVRTDRPPDAQGQHCGWVCSTGCSCSYSGRACRTVKPTLDSSAEPLSRPTDVAWSTSTGGRIAASLRLRGYSSPSCHPRKRNPCSRPARCVLPRAVAIGGHAAHPVVGDVSHCVALRSSIHRTLHREHS